MEGKLGDNSRTLDGRIHVLIGQEDLLPVTALRPLRATILQGYTHDAGTVEILTSVVDDTRFDNGLVDFAKVGHL